MLHIGRVVTRLNKSNFNYAMACVANIKNVQFYQFTPDDIDYENKTIKGTYYNGDRWATKTFPYPDYIYDRVLTKGRMFTKFYDEFEDVPFSNEKTPSAPFSKSEMYAMVRDAIKYKNHAVPSHEVQNIRQLQEHLNTYNKIMCKPNTGSKKAVIFYAEKVGGDIHVNIDQKKEVFSGYQFRNFLTNKVFVNDQTYIVQPFILSQTKAGNPFDIRVNLAKNGKGNWTIIKIQARLGEPQGLISSSGDSVTDLRTLLTKHINVDDYTASRKKIRTFALDFANHLDDQIDFRFGEMALDLTIDEFEHLWLFDVNMHRVSVDHLPLEAAQHAISYGKYIASRKKAKS